MSKVHVKTGDTVYVRSGKDRAHVGKVLKVLPDKGRVIVEGANMVSKHKKPTPGDPQGGIEQMEGSISASSVMLVCDKCKKPTKIGRKTLENGSKIRYCKACGEEIDVISKTDKNKGGDR